MLYKREGDQYYFGIRMKVVLQREKRKTHGTNGKKIINLHVDKFYPPSHSPYSISLHVKNECLKKVLISCFILWEKHLLD